MIQHTHSKLSLAAALAILGLSLLVSPVLAQSTARDPKPPEHVFDLVPGEPPLDPHTGIGRPPQAVTKVRDLHTTPPAGGLGLKTSQTWRDGQRVTITWNPPPVATQVRLYYHGERCSLGGRSRGQFEGIIGAGMIPNTGSTEWTVPWLDGPYLYLRIAAYDDAELPIAAEETGVRLLPREFDDVPDNCIAVSKRLQRLYYLKDGRIQAMHIVSTARNGYSTPKMRPGTSSRRRGAMGRVFNKSYRPFSSLYHCYMPYWLGITSSGSHGIHATSSGFYRLLGRPASHGCVRQHNTDARKLYSMVNVGTPVYVF